jgi:hypothetical protein
MTSFGASEVIEDLIASSYLARVATIKTRKRDLDANDRWPRIVFERLSIESGDSALRGSNPPALQTDSHKFNVHLWGETEEECERLRQLLLTAVRFICLGRNYRAPTATWTENTFETGGVVLVQELEIDVTLPRAAIPSAAVTSPPIESPGTAVENFVYATATIATVDPLDDTGSAAGDGYLDGGEDL